MHGEISRLLRVMKGQGQMSESPFGNKRRKIVRGLDSP